MKNTIPKLSKVLYRHCKFFCFPIIRKGRASKAEIAHEESHGAGAAQTCRSKGDARPAAPAPDQIAWAHELQMRVMLADDDGDDDLRNLLGEVACCLAALTGRAGEPDVAAPADQMAFELPAGAPVIRDVAGADLPANQPEVPQQEELARDALSAVSWLYRRLPRGYGRQHHIEVVIERLARETGTDIAELVEHGPDPSAGGAR